MPIVVLSDPGLLPVDLSTALRHLRVTYNDADQAALYLQAATEFVEDYTGRAGLTKSYQLTLSHWPDRHSIWPGHRGFPREVYQPWQRQEFRAVELRRSPLLSIDSVKYYPQIVDSTMPPPLTVWDTSNYRADLTSTPGRMILLNQGIAWPELDCRPDAVQINFTAGYGLKPENLPARFKMAVLFMARHFFDNRVPVMEASKMAVVPFTLQVLLDNLRVYSITDELCH